MFDLQPQTNKYPYKDMEIVMPSVIELDLGLHKALEAHRISLEESQTDILRRVLDTAPRPAEPTPPSAPIPQDWLGRIFALFLAIFSLFWGRWGG